MVAATFPLAVVLSAVDRITSPLRKVQSTVGNIGKSLTSVGTKLTAGVSLPIAGFATLAVKTGLDFERSFRRIGVNTNATAEELAEMRDAVKALPPDLGMALGVDVLEALADEGMNARDALLAMPPAVLLAKAANIEGAESAQMVADTLDSLGRGAGDAAALVDLLTKSTGGSTANTKNFMQVLQGAGPALKNSGLALEEQIALVKALAAAGIEGSAATKPLKAGITALIKPSQQAKDAMSHLGVNPEDVYDSEGNLRSLGDTLALLRARGASTADFLTIFGASAGQAFAAVDPANVRAARAELENAGGAARDAAAKMADPFVTLQNQLQALGVAIAESGLLKWVTDVVGKVGEFVGRVSQSNPTLMKWATVILGVVAAIGPLLVILGTVISAASTVAGLFASGGLLMTAFAAVATFVSTVLIPAIVALGTAIMATPIGWIIAGIALLIGAVYLLWKHWDKVMKFLKTAWFIFITPVRMGLQMLAKLLPSIADLIPDWLKNLVGIDTPEPAGETAGDTQVAAVAAGGRNETVVKNEAALKVDFDNLPPGAKVTTTKNEGFNLDLGAGYAMGT